MLSKEEKQQILQGKENTGGEEVQVELLSKQIEKFNTHLKESPKDLHSKRGFLRMISKRKKLLAIIKEKDESKYQQLISKLNLKK